MGTSIGTCIVSKTLWSSEGVQSRLFRTFTVVGGQLAHLTNIAVFHQQKEWNVKLFFAHTEVKMPLAYMAMAIMYM